MGQKDTDVKVPLISKICWQFPDDFLYRCFWDRYGGSCRADAVFQVLGRRQ